MEAYGEGAPNRGSLKIPMNVSSLNISLYISYHIINIIIIIIIIIPK